MDARLGGPPFVQALLLHLGLAVKALGSFLFYCVLILPIRTWASDAPSNGQKKSPIEIFQPFSCNRDLRVSIEEPIEIRTPRLILRSAVDADRPGIHALFMDHETRFNLFGRNIPWDDYDTDTELKMYKSGLWQPKESVHDILRVFPYVIARRSDDKIVGVGGLRQYKDGRWGTSAAILPEFRNMGYSTERLKGLIDFVREIQPDAKFQIGVLKTNLESQAVLRNLKFKRMPTTPEDRSFVFSLDLKPQN